MLDQLKDPAPTNTARLGEQIRRLRQNAGLTRAELGAVIGLTTLTLRSLELGLPAECSTWSALLKHPSMRGVPELAAQEGVVLNLVDLGRAARRVLTVAETIDVYLDSLYNRGVLPHSVLTVSHVLRSVFQPALEEPLDTLCPERARSIVDALATRVSTRTRRPLAPRTYQAYCERARAFLAWCVKQNRLPVNPLDPTVEATSSTVR